MENISSEYRKYKFCDIVPLIPKENQWKEYLDSKFDNIDIDVNIDTDGMTEKIENTINSNTENITKRIDEAKEEVKEVVNDQTNVINKAKESVEYKIDTAKDDINCNICCTSKEIKKHIDDKIDPIKFEEKFSNLNEQVSEILNKLNKE